MAKATKPKTTKQLHDDLLQAYLASKDSTERLCLEVALQSLRIAESGRRDASMLKHINDALVELQGMPPIGYRLDLLLSLIDGDETPERLCWKALRFAEPHSIDPDSWSDEQLAAATSVLEVWKTEARGKWRRVNEFLLLFGMHVNQRTAGKKHPLSTKASKAHKNPTLVWLQRLAKNRQPTK